MTDLPRTQHIIASGVVAAVGLVVAWISWTAEPAQAFLFPRLIATAFVVLAIWTFAKALLGRTKVGPGLDWLALFRILPGLAVLLVYVFWAAKGLGFYTATAIAVFILLTMYDPAPNGQAKTWIKRVIITAVFTAVMWGLFDKLLGVFTPREILF